MLVAQMVIAKNKRLKHKKQISQGNILNISLSYNLIKNLQLDQSFTHYYYEEQ